MAKSSLLMRAATSGGGSSRLMMVLRRSFSSALNTAEDGQGGVRPSLNECRRVPCVLA